MSYPPPIINEDRDPHNIVSGCRILWFQEASMLEPLELHIIRIRGRDSLPPEKYFSDHDVFALETASAWQEPVPGTRNLFERRVLIRPKDSKLITHHNSFFAGQPEKVHFVFGPKERATD